MLVLVVIPSFAKSMDRSTNISGTQMTVPNMDYALNSTKLADGRRRRSLSAVTLDYSL